MRYIETGRESVFSTRRAPGQSTLEGVFMVTKKSSAQSDAASKPDMMADLDLAYVGGFFDGEGSVTIHENCRPSPRGKRPNHTLQVSIGNTDPRVLIRLHSVFGGGLCYRERKNPRERKFCQWSVRAARALPFLEAIQPFVRMKCDQVAVAIAYQRTKCHHGPDEVSAETIAWREEQRRIIRALNARAWIQ